MRIERITSRENQRLINARKVRDGKVPGRIFVEGRRLVLELLRSQIVVEECFFSEEFDDAEMRSAFHGPTFELPARLLASIADTDQPQGVVVIARSPVETSLKIELSAASLPVVIFLHEINNPSNLGAVIRTAEAAGAAGVITSTHSADAFSPKALRAAMGSSFRVPIWSDAAFDDVLRWAAERHLVATATGSRAAKSYTTIDWKRPRLLIFGSEATGLAEAQLATVEEVVAVPMENRVDSLNLAVSAGIILYEAKRQNDI